MKQEHWKQYRPLILSAVLSVGVAIAIFCFSSQTHEASDGLSGDLAKWLLKLLGMEADDDALTCCNVILRKAAHFTLYALFGLGLCGVLQWQRWLPALPAAVALCALYALTDEFHQLFVDGRTSQLLDVGIDTCGALVGATVAALLRRRQRQGSGQSEK